MNAAERAMKASFDGRTDMSGAEDLAQDVSAENIKELQRSIANQKDPELRMQLVEELQRVLKTRDDVDPGGAGFEFKRVDDGKPASAGFEFKTLPGQEAPAPASMPAATPEHLPPNPMNATPTGAATGRTEVPAPRLPFEPTKEDNEFLRVGVETLTSGAGALAGAPLGPVGMRAGEALGATAGSLISESFDPTTSPLATAAQTGAVTLATGKASDFAAAGLRRLIGKPTAVGLDAVKMLEKNGTMPPVGAVFDSGFMRDMQSVGSSAFGIGHRLERISQDALEVTSKQLDDYVQSFERFHVGATNAYKNAEKLLPQTRIVPVDRKHFEAARSLIETWEREGVLHKADPAVRMMKQVLDSPGVRRVNLTIHEAEVLEQMLFNRARELEHSKKMGTISAGGSNIISGRWGEAWDVRTLIDSAIDDVVKNRGADAMAKAWLRAGRESWKVWKQGELIETMVANSSVDLAGDGLVKGQRLLNKIDDIVKQQEGLKMTGAGRHRDLLTTEQVTNLRKYANVLKAIEDSGRESGFQFGGRRGQIIGMGRMVSGAAAAGGLTGGAAAGLPGAAGGALVGGALGVMTPHALAYVFSNKQAMALMLRGLKLDPTSALAARTMRELTTLLVNEGVLPPERVEEDESASGGGTPRPALGRVSGQMVPNPGPNRQYGGSGIRG